jgi:HAE1 family hydrophobic/amphiphilic exporter-1
VDDVQATLVLGGFLTVMIVFFFLNSWRSTVITGLALPVSVISTFIIMRALGFTLNVLTLRGLSLAIGLLIDDAIVVRENIVRHMHAGADHFTAARKATGEIGLAVMATTLTIVAVFVPVAFMDGIIGRFFFQFGITVGFAVLVSLYVSFTLDPMLSSRWYDPAADPRAARSRFGLRLARLNARIDRLPDVAASALRWSLSHRWAVTGLATASVIASFFLFGELGSAFMPVADPGQFLVSYKASPGISLEHWSEIARELESEIRRTPGVAYAYTTIGGTAGKPINEGSIFIRLNPRKAREHYSLIKPEVRRQLSRFRAVETSIEEAGQVGGNVKPIQISVRGAELARLEPWRKN